MSGLRVPVVGPSCHVRHAPHPHNAASFSQRTCIRRFRQNADPFSQNSPISPFFTQLVCTLAAKLRQVAAVPSPIGGNCTTRGCDTPATRRKRASCSAKPPPSPVWRVLEGPEGLAAVLMSGGRAWPRQISHAIPPRHDPTQAKKPQNINDQISKPEILSGELHAKLLSGKQDEATHSNESVACVREPARKGRAWLRCPWAVAGPGWASRRRAEPKARGADDSRAGRSPAHTQPGTHTAHTARGPKRRSASGPHAHACQLTG